MATSLTNNVNALISSVTATTTTGTSGNDFLVGGIFGGTIYGGAGNDYITGGAGRNWLYGGSGADTIFGGLGPSWIYGDGPAELVRKAIDLDTDAAWSTLSTSKTALKLDDLTITSTGGELSRYLGASILSPNDTKLFTKEIDSYNDTPEVLHLDFGVAQSNVTITLYQMYQEQLFQRALDAEKALVTIHFTDGTSVTKTVTATATTKPGEAAITLKSSDFGGKLIGSIDLTADPVTPTLPANASAATKASYNATHAYSEFTLKSVDYSIDLNNLPGNDDTLFGSAFGDELHGGKGNDFLSGLSGNDLLVGGAGDNSLWSGLGKDVFGFGWDATGNSTIYDINIFADKLKLYDGVTVTGASYSGLNTILTLSTGGTITVLSVTKLTDWHTLF